MKKLRYLCLGLALIAFSSTAVQAQQTTVDSLKSQYNNTVDTVTNAATKYLYSPQIRGYQALVSLTCAVTSISGTISGTMSVEASMVGGTNDGDWYPVTSYGVSDSTKGTWIFTPTNVAKRSYHWKITEWENLYLRVKYTGANTMSAKISAYYLARRETLSTLYQ